MCPRSLPDKQNWQHCVIFLAKCEERQVCEVAAEGVKVPRCNDPNHPKVTALLHIIITSLSFLPRLAPSPSGSASCKQKVMEEEEDSCHCVATVNFRYGLRLLNTQKLPGRSVTSQSARIDLLRYRGSGGGAESGHLGNNYGNLDTRCITHGGIWTCPLCNKWKGLFSFFPIIFE